MGEKKAMSETEDTEEQTREYRRKQIMDAALAVFSKKGYGEATIPDIAREAGVAVGTIYNYYGSKRDLLVSIVNTFVITQPFRELLKQAGQGEERKFVRSVIRNRLDWGFENMDKFLFV